MLFIKNKIVKFAPFLTCTFVIFALTFQSAEATTKQSMVVQESVTQIVSSSGLGREKVIQFWWYDFTNFRKLAHVVEYFALGLTAVIPFLKNVDKKKSIIFAIVMSAAVSICDESFKTFLPKREFDFNDLLLDIIGIVMGIVFTLMFVKVATSVKRKESC